MKRNAYVSREYLLYYIIANTCKQIALLRNSNTMKAVGFKIYCHALQGYLNNDHVLNGTFEIEKVLIHFETVQ